MNCTMKRPEMLMAVGKVKVANRVYYPSGISFLCVGGVPVGMRFERLTEIPGGVIEKKGTRLVKDLPDVPMNLIYDTDLHSDYVTTEKDNYTIYDEMFDELKARSGCLVWNVHGKECADELEDYEKSYADEWLVPLEIRKVLTNRSEIGGDVWVCIDGKCHLVKEGSNTEVSLKKEVIDAIYEKTGINILDN